MIKLLNDMTQVIHLVEFTPVQVIKIHKNNHSVKTDYLPKKHMINTQNSNKIITFYTFTTCLHYLHMSLKVCIINYIFTIMYQENNKNI